MVVQATGSDNLRAALEWEAAGCSVIPIRADGSKKPAFEWKAYQKRRATREEITRWWTQNPNYGIAVICGAVSGNLEMTELEARATDGDHFDRIQGVADVAFDNWDQWVSGHRTYAELSPSGGVHLLYRVAGGVVPGNTKIANTAGNDTLVETRGEGGYVIVAPSGGRVHPTGEDWRAINGCLPAGIKTLPFSLRDELHNVLKTALDERPVAPVAPPMAPKPTMPSSIGETPGDAWERVTSWQDILEPAGWTFHSRTHEGYFWTRPGKDRRDGHSASTGHANDRDRLYVWSSATDLPTETPLTKFFVWAHYNFGGQMSLAAAELRRQGFGTDRPLVREPEDWSMFPDEPEQVKRPEKPAKATESKQPSRCRLDVISADQFKVKRVKWLWKDRIPIGEITLIPGREGVGKSLFLAKIAADITNGTLEGEFYGTPRPIIYVANEDSWNHTVAPRMIAAGADMSKVLKLIIREDADDLSSFRLPRDNAALTELIVRTGAGAVMFDPILSCLDDTIDVNKAQSLRGALEPLRRAAEQSGCSVLALMHFNKSTSGDLSTKISGSRAFTEVARSIIGLAKLPKKKSGDEMDDFMAGPAECVISQSKNNLGRLDLPNLTYRIDNMVLQDSDDGEDANVGYLVLTGESEMSAEDALNGGGDAVNTSGVSELMQEIVKYVEDDYASNGMPTSTQMVIQRFEAKHKPDNIRKTLSRAKLKGLLNSPRWGVWEPGH